MSQAELAAQIRGVADSLSDSIRSIIAADEIIQAGSRHCLELADGNTEGMGARCSNHLMIISSMLGNNIPQILAAQNELRDWASLVEMF